jgi:hypothetical protein
MFMEANAQVKPTRVAEQTAWQALPAMLFVERNEFGLNALLGLTCGNILSDRWAGETQNRCVNEQKARGRKRED